MSLQMRTGFALADLYLARGRVRAELNMQGYSRLSDVFNNGSGDFLSGHLRMSAAVHSASGQPEISVERRELIVRRDDIRLVRPIEEQPSVASTEAWRERTPVRVVMDLDDWQVTGEIHLLDRIPWLDFVAAAARRFIPMSNVSVRFVGVADTLDCPYVLINGARVSTLYEAP